MVLEGGCNVKHFHCYILKVFLLLEGWKFFNTNYYTVRDSSDISARGFVIFKVTSVKIKVAKLSQDPNYTDSF